MAITTSKRIRKKNYLLLANFQKKVSRYKIAVVKTPPGWPGLFLCTLCSIAPYCNTLAIFKQKWCKCFWYKHTNCLVFLTFENRLHTIWVHLKLLICLTLIISLFAKWVGWNQSQKTDGLALIKTYFYGIIFTFEFNNHNHNTSFFVFNSANEGIDTYKKYSLI